MEEISVQFQYYCIEQLATGEILEALVSFMLKLVAMSHIVDLM